MHSTLSLIEAPPEKVRVMEPLGCSPGSKRTASSDSTRSACDGFTAFSCAESTRSKRSAVRRRSFSLAGRSAPPSPN